MTEQQAQAEAQRRNQEAGERGWDADTPFWVWVEREPGDWIVEVRSPPDPSLWERLSGFVLDGVFGWIDRNGG